MPRRALPQRRSSETISFRVNGLDYSGTAGFYRDGTVGEIFLDCAKSGTDAQVSARDAAIAVSFALQFGVPLETIRSALTRRADGAAEGPAGVLLDFLSENG